MNRVALIGENSVEYVNVLLDIWNNGDCAVLLDWRIPFETAVKMMVEANVTRCYIESGKFEISSPKASNPKCLKGNQIQLNYYLNTYMINTTTTTQIMKRLLFTVPEQLEQPKV